MYQNPPPPNVPMDGAQPLIPPSNEVMTVPGQPIPPLAQPYPVAQPIPVAQPVPQAQPYPSPVQNQPIVVNQVVPYVPVKFKTSPVSMVCPFCKKSITTVVNTEFNCGNCCFCFCFCLIWLIVMLASDKDLNCSDATHKCPSCGNVLGKYQSC